LFLLLPPFIKFFENESFRYWGDVRESCFAKYGETEESVSWFQREASLQMFLYLSFSLILAVVGFIWGVTVFVYSGRGTPSWTEPREKPLQLLCHVNLTLFHALRVVCCFWGVVCLTLIEQYCACFRIEHFSVDTFIGVQNELEHICRNYNWTVTCLVGLVITHMIDALVVTISLTYFFCKCIPVTKIATKIMFLSRERLWKICCRFCFVNLSCFTCFLYGGGEAMRGDLTDFAVLMSKYFGYEDYLDVTASDAFAALLMLKRSHLQDEMEAKQRFAKRAMEREKENQQDEADNDATGVEQAKRHYDILNRIYQSARFTLHILTSHQGVQEAERVVQSWTPALSVSYVEASKSSIIEEEDEEDDIVDTDDPQIATSTAKPPPLRLIPRIRSTLNVRNETEIMVVAEGARFIHHAEAIYFWAAVKKKAPFLKRWQNNAIKKKADSILIDHARQFTGLAPIPGISPRDVQYTQFKQSMSATPYVVVVDHSWRSVCISIRGTVSIEDMLTDITLQPAELQDQGELRGFDGTGKFCHRGVKARVEWIYDDLKENCNLHDLLVSDDAPFKGYRLRVTGHSLGAACAALLTLFLRNGFPRVRCLAFSPPGCTVSENLSIEMEEYVTSYILDTDVVGRASAEAFLGFRDELLEIIARIKIPKHKVFVAGRKEKGRAMPLDEFNRQALCSTLEIDRSTDYAKKLDIFYELESEKKEQVVKLYPPGRIIQLFRTINLPKSNSACGLCCCGPEADSRVDVLEDVPYTARWAEREDFSRLVLSSHFLSDHETANVKGQLHILAERAGLKEPFSSVLPPQQDVEEA